MNEIVIHTMSVFKGIHDCFAIRHAQDDELEIQGFLDTFL